MFSGIVSRALTLEVLSTGVPGKYNGALQVVSSFIRNLICLVLFEHTLGELMVERDNMQTRLCRYFLICDYFLIDLDEC